MPYGVDDRKAEAAANADRNRRRDAEKARHKAQARRDGQKLAKGATMEFRYVGATRPKRHALMLNDQEVKLGTWMTLKGFEDPYDSGSKKWKGETVQLCCADPFVVFDGDKYITCSKVLQMATTGEAGDPPAVPEKLKAHPKPKLFKVVAPDGCILAPGIPTDSGNTLHSLSVGEEFKPNGFGLTAEGSCRVLIGGKGWALWEDGVVEAETMACITRREHLIYQEDFTAFEKDGKCTKDDALKLALHQLGREASEQELKVFVASTDLNNDGIISCDEYIEMILGEPFRVI